MKIGIVRENSTENRVVILPEQVPVLKKLNAEILIERSAGISAFASDEDYSNAGANVVERQVILDKAGLILSVNGLEEQEYLKLKENQFCVGALNLLGNPSLVQSLKNCRGTLFSLDLVPRTSRAQSMDILSSMATVSGYKAVLEAALLLPRFFPMFMSAAGTIKPAKVLILGAGVAGLQALATSRKLGAVVEVFDVRSAVKEEVMSLGGKFIEVQGAQEDKSAGGYAIEQSEEFKQKQSQMIHDHAVSADVIICTAQIPGKKAPVLLKSNTVEAMRPGSVIIDLAASTGGNCACTENGKTIKKAGVTIVGKSDYPNAMSVDASSMFGKNMLNFIQILFDDKGVLRFTEEDEILKASCVVHQGTIISERLKTM